MNDLPFTADKGEALQHATGRKWRPAGYAGNWRCQKATKNQRTFNYTDLPTFGNRFFCFVLGLFRIPLVLAFAVYAIGVSGAISELDLEISLTGILRF